MTNKNLNWLSWITEIQTIAQNGLTFSQNDFDKERYSRLRELAAEVAAYYSENNLTKAKNLFLLEEGYATPKLDVRSFILHENKLLLVRERVDNLWTLPGGWADVNESPSEAVIRETREETGFDVAAIHLLALWDKLKHDHPPQWPHAYKCFFHCELLSGEATPNLEISEVDFFAVDKLPPLSTHRVTQKQILRLYEHMFHSTLTLFD
ncbi:MAG: NUDIX hydrolase [Legionella sp.]|uniref:NUDIX hydrolase n=1 Tax=Legionella sp. TaxID=459 RepID=UPI0039E2315F